MSWAGHTACDAGAAHAVDDIRSASRRTEHPRLVLATTILASSLAFIDGSVVNVGLPAIGASLGAGAGDLQWVVNAYLLPLSALILLGGGAGDRYGRRRLLIGGIGLFVLASLACAAAPSLPLLIAGRVAQGVGAAVLLPNSLAILGAAFTGAARGRAVGTWAAVGSMAGAIGPVLGGWLIDTVGWRAIFLLNLPLGLAAIVLAWRYVHDARPAAAPSPLDWTGGGLATAGLGAITLGLTLGSGPGGWSALAIGATAAGAVAMAAFVGWEKRRGDAAMTPLALFGSKSLVGLNLLTLLLYAALGALTLLIPFVLIETAGYSATAAGAALLPFPLIMAAASPAMGAFAGRIGARPLLVAGCLIVAAGFGLSTRIGAAADYWTDVLPGLLLVSVGMACAVSPLTTAVLSSVDARHTGSASGLNSALARAGGLVAVALMGAVLAARGAALIAAFHGALWLSAAACVGAALSALALVDDTRRQSVKT